ncbi:MAG: hypothetical protein FWH32_00250 [Clostridiales bacterium]|nr:hypothetical protein [Clostridiales bacterium]
MSKEKGLIERIKERDYRHFLYETDAMSVAGKEGEGGGNTAASDYKAGIVLSVVLFLVGMFLNVLLDSVSLNVLPFAFAVFVVVAAFIIRLRGNHGKTDPPDIKEIFRNNDGAAAKYFPAVINYQEYKDRGAEHKILDYREKDVKVLRGGLQEVLREDERPLLLVASSGMGKTILLGLTKDSYENEENIECPDVVNDYRADSLVGTLKKVLDASTAMSQLQNAGQGSCESGLEEGAASGFEEKVGVSRDVDDLKRLAGDIKGSVSNADGKLYIFFDQFEKVLHEEAEMQEGIAEVLAILSASKNIAVLVSIRADRFHELFTNAGLSKLANPSGNCGRPKILTVQKIGCPSTHNGFASINEKLQEKAESVLSESSTSIEQAMALHFLAQESDALAADIDLPVHQDVLKKADCRVLIEHYFERLLCEKGRYLDAAQVFYLIAKYSMLTDRGLEIVQIKSAIYSYGFGEKVDGILKLLEGEGLIARSERHGEAYCISHDFVAERYIAYVESKSIMDTAIKALLDQYCMKLKNKQDRKLKNEQDCARPSAGGKRHNSFKKDYGRVNHSYWVPFVIAAAAYVAISFFYDQATMLPTCVATDILKAELGFLKAEFGFPYVFQWLVMMIPLITILAFLHSWVLYSHAFLATKSMKGEKWRKNWCGIAFLLPPIAAPIFLYIWLRFIAGTTAYEIWGLLPVMIIILPSIWIYTYLLPRLRPRDDISQDMKETIKQHATRYLIPLAVGGGMIVLLYFLLDRGVFWQFASIMVVLLLVGCFIYLLWSQAKRSYCMQLFVPLKAIWYEEKNQASSGKK